MTIEDDVAVAVCTIPYAKPTRVLEDVTTTAKEFPSLICQKGEYEYEDGRRESLVCLSGTLPINYYGVTYNIPLAIWVCLPYPHLAPLAYITPTPTIGIKDNHRHVDRAGRCYLPYLHSWAAHSHHLRHLCSELIAVFSDDPPVYARATPVPSSPSPASSSPTPWPSSSHGHAGPPTGQWLQPGRQPPQPYDYAYSPPPISSDNLKRKDMEVEDNRTLLLVKISSLKHTLDAEMDADFMRQRVAMEKQQCRDTSEVLQSLRNQKAALTNAMNQCAVECDAVQRWLREKDRGGNGAVEDVDAASCPSVALATQRLELVAEDLAVEDLVYHLDRRLCDNDGTLDFDTWFRTLRNVSRKQFEYRALALRCEEALNRLPQPTGSPAALPWAAAADRGMAASPSGLYPSLESSVGAIPVPNPRPVAAAVSAEARPRSSLYPAEAFRQGYR
eukprot:EG_transcript_8173